MPGDGKTFIDTWLERHSPKGCPKNVSLLNERPNQRRVVETAIRKAVVDHLVGVEIVASIGGFKKAAKVIENAMPTTKQTRSGDIGEIIATEYVSQTTKFAVPVRRLRYKDDRKVAMRGDDVLGFEFGTTPPNILKVESKSRISLTSAVVKEASEGLCRHNGRPNPSTLSFISRRLREYKQHELAEIVERLQEEDIPLTSLSHLIFTLSGNNPADALSSATESPIASVTRQLVGCVVADHAAFVAKLFDGIKKGS